MAAFRCDDRECGVVVRVEAIVFHLDTTRLLCGLLLLAPSPEEDSSDNKQRYDHDGNNDGDRSGACSAKTFVASIAAVLGVEGCRSRGARAGG